MVANSKNDDPRRMKPGALCRLLNATPLGEVINDKRLYRHRQRPDGKIGDGRIVDILRYAAWLVEYKANFVAGESWGSVKERARKRAAAISAEGRDIGELPAVVNPVRRDRCRTDFKHYCEEYHPETFCLGWSKDHLRVIEKIEATMLRGGQDAIAMPRGSGKSSLCETGCEWAVLYGHRSFVALIAASEPLAKAALDSIKSELESNDELFGDFPEVCLPIRTLDGITARAAGQLYQGKRTHIEWKAGEIVLPTMPGSDSSGAIIKTAGITGAVRGMKHKLRNGKTVRPSAVLIDDFQTAASAKSANQCQERLRIISGDVLGMAGPDVRIAALAPMTVVRKGDAADQLLDQEKHPEWESERCPLVYKWPQRVDLWDKFKSVLIESEGNGEERQKRATEFYRKNREAMDEGAVVGWADRFIKETQLSALQYAYEWKIRDEEAFAAEAQQSPLSDDSHATQLQADDVMQKCTTRERRLVPYETTHLTAFIDIQQTGLFYVVIAWQPEFSGSVIDYGTWPNQPKPYFQRADMAPTMMEATGADSIESAIYAALEKLTAYLAGSDWDRDRGGIQTLDKLLIDANWGKSTPTVYQFCRESIFKNVLMPSHGMGLGPHKVPFSEHAITPQEQVGLEWKIVNNVKKRPIPYCLIDTNYWKSFVVDRWTTAKGGKGSLTIYGDRPAAHQMFADHQTAEYSTPTSGRGRTVNVFTERPGRENDYLDAVVGCAVGASICGVSLAGTQIREDRRTSGADQWNAFLGTARRG